MSTDTCGRVRVERLAPRSFQAYVDDQPIGSPHAFAFQSEAAAERWLREQSQCGFVTLTAGALELHLDVSDLNQVASLADGHGAMVEAAPADLHDLALELLALQAGPVVATPIIDDDELGEHYGQQFGTAFTSGDVRIEVPTEGEPVIVFDGIEMPVSWFEAAMPAVLRITSTVAYLEAFDG